MPNVTPPVWLRSRGSVDQVRIVTLLCLRRLLAVSRCDASLVLRNAGRRIYGAWKKPGSVRCSPEWHLYITARSVHRRFNNEVEKKDTRPALLWDFWQYPLRLRLVLTHATMRWRTFYQ